MKKILETIDKAIQDGLKNTRNMDKDEFAVFLADEILNIRNYNYDMFYDIAKIIRLEKEALSKLETRNKQFQEIHLMLRETGSDLIDPKDENYSIYELRSNKIYKLTFCWNSNYFSYEDKFCKVETIKDTTL